MQKGTQHTREAKMKISKNRKGRAKLGQHPNWKGGKINRGGYLYILMRDHPHSNKQGYIAEHRIVIEKHIGRYLLPQEAIHHKNHNKIDNRIENLELCPTHGQHTLLHHPEVVGIMKTINIGQRRSPRTEFKKEQKPWNSGMKLSYKARPKMSLSARMRDTKGRLLPKPK